MSFDTVLIANRGEIARRLIRAVKSLGLTAVAVYSDADRVAPYVRDADKAVHLGPSEASKSYLDIQKILDAAERSGAGAIHPGYGFLSENAEFARACESLGIAFIGPRSDLIAEMGSKIAAKASAIAAGVPVVPGYQGADQSDAALMKAAKEVGYPLMIKASAGGGGRGMRLVTNAEELGAAITLARQEAEAAFADGALLMERYIANARHVEVQVLGDKAGHVIHLYDRDCSLQRNHQKIVEEAPAPNLPEEVRRHMLTSAASLAAEIGYDSAGTVEFIYDPASEEYFFLEMNTRLQVEHPVTERITGVDIAAWQIRIAGGERLSLTQEDIHVNGWAIEARVTAEDPAAGYLPQTGEISYYREPDHADVRLDSGITSGSVIGHHYDSLLSKVIAWGATREDAIRKLGHALRDYRLIGVTTNIPFLCDILKEGAFRSASHHTLTLKQMLDDGWQGGEACLRDKALALLCWHLHQQQSAHRGPWGDIGSWRITARTGRRGSGYYYLPEEDGMMDCQVTDLPNGYQLRLSDLFDGIFTEVTLGEDSISYTYQGLGEISEYQILGGDLYLFTGKTVCHLTPMMPEQALLSKQGGGGASGNKVIAPMPGLVVDILTAPGATVTKGEPLLVLEAMKLMQKLSAPCDGVVEMVHVKSGDTPEKDAILITINNENAA